ncbi:MAG: hypothetical protein RJA61_135 [Candidatus Parcubacteria bacterium]|jgi:dipeptidyl aminopeptidase/acylaminoacyl peptidase
MVEVSYFPIVFYINILYMNHSLKILKTIPLILDVKKISLHLGIREKLGDQLWEKAVSNSKKINIYRIIYKSGGNKVVGFIIEPRKNSAKLPCIIWNRGGTGDFGSIKQGQLFLELGKFAKEGYLVIASNYSGSPGSEGVDDMGGKNLINILDLYKILKIHPCVDIKRIGMYGWSRGGMMTYMCLAKVRWIKVAIIGAGPTDEIEAPQFRKGWREHQIGIYGESREEQIKRSALYWPEKFSKKTPLLMMHGTADWRVNPADSICLAEKLYKNKVPFRLVMFEGGDHGLNDFKDEVDRLEIEWFEKYLKHGEKWPSLKPHGR